MTQFGVEQPGRTISPCRLDLAIPLSGLVLRDHRGALEEIARLGYDGVWSGEGTAHDAFIPLGLAAAWSPSLRLGTGIVPAYTRGPALLAQTVAGMCEAAPGRFVLGIGSSSPVLVERWNGMAYERPLQRLRDLVRFLKEALTGAKVSVRYDTFAVSGFQLGTERPDPVPPILVAGLRPKMLQMGAQEADGVILNWVSPEDIDRVSPLLATGKELVVRVKVVPTTDWSAVRAVAVRLINAYFHVASYRKAQEWLGRAEVLRPMWDAWAAGDRRGASAAIPDEVIADLFVWGSPARIRRGLEAYAAKGATSLVAAIYGTSDEVMSTVRLMAPSPAGQPAIHPS